MPQCCTFTVRRSAKPARNTSGPWGTAARSCQCYHRLSHVTAGYHAALCPRNSSNAPLAFPARWAQDALSCNQSIGHTPLEGGGHGRGFGHSGVSCARTKAQASHRNRLMVTPLPASLPPTVLVTSGSECLALLDATRSLMPLISLK